MVIFFFKQKTAYEMRISDWSSDVCSSDLWRYLAIAALAALLTIAAYPWVQRMNNPVQLFDALGLGFFAVFGAHKALAYGHNIEVAIILGVISAVGGGVMRDILLNRTPQIGRAHV